MSKSKNPLEQYHELMSTIAGRFKVTNAIRSSGTLSNQDIEAIGFQLRKIVEGVAFSCLVAVENGLKQIPRDASGQWNADKIFLSLQKRGTIPLPNPNIQRPATEEELAQYPGIKYVMEGEPDKCLSVDDLHRIYRDTHKWTHEQNPYLGRKIKEADVTALLNDVDAVFEMLNYHMNGINGQSLWCDLKDASGEEIVVASASKVMDT